MIGHIQHFIIPATFALLPPAMTSPKAVAMLLAIGLQESKFLHRRQLPQGPARGFFQFERGGVAGVLEHRRTAAVIASVIRDLQYPPVPAGHISPIHAVLEHNDLLACAFARCLLWTLPAAVPGPEEATLAWGQYLAAWRPGRPHPETWEAHYAEAWARVHLAQPETNHGSE